MSGPFVAGLKACWPIWNSLTRSPADYRALRLTFPIGSSSSRSNLLAIMRSLLALLEKG